MAKTIGVKELHHNLKKVVRATQRGTSFIVTKHRKPIFRIEPVDEKKFKYTLEDLADIRFSTDDPDLSKKVDEIVYGI